MTILCYHSIDPDWTSPLAVAPDDFARHCAWLAGNRRMLDLDVAVAQMDPSGRLPRGTAALTFDDGLAPVFDRAFPVLRRYAIPVTVFLVAETLSPTGRAVDWVDDAADRTLRTLSAEQVLEMLAAGVRFGSHSYGHRDLTSLGEEACEQDLRQSRELLEDLLGRPVRHVAYPRGLHDERVRRAAARAGFTHGFSLPESREPVGPLSVPRVGVYRGNGLLALRAKVSPGFLRWRTLPAYRVLHRLIRPSRAPRRVSG
jgi:peptidoglycan/xylan/chitin deacetylase (PgdA/CDA1 family)